eukprot:8098396-Pyramimonas_sp.AAC.1
MWALLEVRARQRRILFRRLRDLDAHEQGRRWGLERPRARGDLQGAGRRRVAGPAQPAVA